MNHKSFMQKMYLFDFKSPETSISSFQIPHFKKPTSNLCLITSARKNYKRNKRESPLIWICQRKLQPFVSVQVCFSISHALTGERLRENEDDDFRASVQLERKDENARESKDDGEDKDGRQWLRKLVTVDEEAAMKEATSSVQLCRELLLRQQINLCEGD